MRGAALEAFVADAKRVGAAVRAAGAGDAQCPTNVQASSSPVVDMSYLDAIASPDRPREETSLRVSAFVRSGATFGDDIPAAVAAAKGGAPMASGLKLPELGPTELVVVTTVAQAKLPVVTQEAFTGGELVGAIAVVEWKSGKVLCRAALAASSSDTVKFGGGATLRVGGIPGPTLGRTELDEAVNNDFKARISAAKVQSLKRIHGE
jgi:hypothetical protein